MYDAAHAVWLFSSSSSSTDSSGNYTLTEMTNASKNEGTSYQDSDDIPAGNNTLVAYTGFRLGQKSIVAVQSVVTNFDGTIWSLALSEVSPFSL